MKKAIHEMVDKIQSDKLIKRIYKFIQYIYIRCEE